MIVVIDHFDSFVETLARYIREAGHATRILRQDSDVAAVLALEPQAIILSPGPGRPDTTGLTLPLLGQLSPDIPVLGICLGHQALAQHLGGTVERAQEPRHGKASAIHHAGDALFDGMGNPFEAGRYHALIVEALPQDCVSLAHSDRGENMAFKHKTRPLYGVQFHPESILTPDGRRMIDNFLSLANCRKDAA
ncbi:MAG: aminodeoxychorismate/anthranilate synthase component II [Alphaproteobacteria bacterium]|nr:aminodeoxychorismate/anthranilate synthase component II [Alphaproteobacteria bacterium]